MSDPVAREGLGGTTRQGGWSFASLWAVGIGALAVALLFTALSLWLYAYRPGLMPFPPMLWLGVIAGGGMVLALFRRNWEALWGTPMLFWCMIFFAWNVLGLIVAAGRPTALPEFASAVVTVSILVAMILISAEARVLRVLQQLIVVAVLLAVATNVIDLFIPLTFSRNFGRSAGFYVNPNISGYAIGTGMLIGLPVVAGRWRPWFVILCGTGVFLTLSRGAMLNWMACTGFLIAYSVLPLRRVAWAALLVAVVGVGGITVTGRLQAIIAAFDLTDRKAWSRLEISGETVQTDESVQTRAYVARRAFETFEEHPILGAGLGATGNWDVQQDTHDMYLKHLAVFGVLGPFIFLSYGLLVGLGGVGETKLLGRAYTIFLLLEGVASHNVLEDRASLVAAAIMVGMVTRSRLDAGPVHSR
jgi:hypothetical protein